MTAVSFLFYCFAGLALLGALSVVFSRHPVRAVLSLILTLVCGAVLWILLQVEFLGLALVVVYVGAVMVLFLFVVMMIDVEIESRKKTYVSYAWLVFLVTLLFFGVLVSELGPHYFGLAHFPAPADLSVNSSNIESVGMLLFTQYLYPFEVAGILLLSAMLAAIALTFRGRKSGTKTQIIADQVRTKAEDRLTLVKMDVTQEGFEFPVSESSVDSNEGEKA